MLCLISIMPISTKIILIKYETNKKYLRTKNKNRKLIQGCYAFNAATHRKCLKLASPGKPFKYLNCSTYDYIYYL